MNLKQFRTNELPDAPIYISKPYVVLSSEGVILAAGTAEEVRLNSNYYDDCTVDIRRHDMHLNDNTKVTSTKHQHVSLAAVLRNAEACTMLPRVAIEQLKREHAALVAVAEAAWLRLSEHDGEATKANFKRCGCNDCKAMRPALIALATVRARQSVKPAGNSVKLMELAQRVARLNPEAGEIGDGMLAQLVTLAKEATGEA